MFFVVSTVVVAFPLKAAPFAAIVMDGRTGEILYEKNAYARLHPASLTKMMTLYIAFQEIEAGRLSLDTMVTVSKYAASQPPSRLGLKPGQRISMRHLIRAAAIKSANDAASAIGDHISGDHEAFAKRMTRTARQLGMNNTTFRNANGLTAEGHLSTAHDMNVLGRHLFYDFPQYYHIFSRRTADAGIATVTNTNSRFLDSYEGADGIKTGFTSPAGFNLTASARRGNKHIIATIFGGTSSAARNAKMAELMDIGFGKARNGVKEQPPKVAPIEDALVASLDTAIDEIDAVGGAGKTVRVSGEVRKSPRPKARPAVPVVPDAVAVAMAQGIEGALAEATAEPAPEGTLDFQAQAMAAAEQATEAPMALAEAAPAAEALPETLIAAAVEEAAVPVVAPEPGTLEAQAMALAAPAAGTLLAEAAPEMPVASASEALADPALAAFKPKARPEPSTTTDIAAAEPEPEPEAGAPVAPVAEVTAETMAPGIVLAEAGPALEVTHPGPDAAAEGPAALLADVTAVETVAGAAAMAPAALAADLAPNGAASVMPKRQAPIFERPQTAEVQQEPRPTEEVVVVMSTSGGRHFGVNVGEYSSRYEADRALLKTALAESATLNEGNRRAIQSGGKWRASFMGLTEEQAQLACRRLMARAIPCETVGG
ncbi:D-alanyl-D-alanine carboxypeptidase family protein [Rhodobacter calidifons]|uniref:D-alanyl-D-alanine carboxypeptidase n=1 Tax=Rhodobacter calidifons TaxID=2715277 RepID=A0ABX0G4Q7_9RHOB|nr:D-alanyl-D-alanine carboxypeptidase [Rhodobacter calidifons]